MWKGRMGEWGEGTVSGRGIGEKGVEVGWRGKLRGREKNNGVFRGLAIWILTSKLV